METKAVIVIDGTTPQPGIPFGAPRLAALEHVANRPILSHAFDALRGAGIDNVIITGEPDALLEIQLFLDAFEFDARGIDYALRRGGSTLSATLEAVAPLVGESACVLQPGDGLLETPIRSLIDRFELEARSSEPIIFATGGGGPRASYRRLAPPDPSEAPDELGWSGLGLFAAGALLSACGELSGRISDSADVLSGWRFPPSLAAARLEEISGWYRYRGDHHELLELNRIALDRLVSSMPVDFVLSNKLEGRLRIDPAATVRDSVIVGPVVIGPGAVVQDAYVGPWTSIGAGARVEGAEIERSIVSPGASITHIGERGDLELHRRGRQGLQGFLTAARAPSVGCRRGRSRPLLTRTR